METILHIVFIIALGFIGAALGSFAGAQVWRIRAEELAQDKKDKKKIDEKEFRRLKPLLGQTILSDRSIDLDTGKKLPWYDLIPIYSWITLRGRSRFSKKPIGKFELWIELGLAAFFIISYLAWPYELVSLFEIARFILWLSIGVVMAVLFSYDYKWYVLPNNYMVALGALGFLNFLMALSVSENKMDTILNTAASLLILSGLYYALYLYSKEKWVGLGDSMLGVGLALILINWQLSFLALFLANLIGVLLVLPGMIRGKLSRTSTIPLGPLLIFATAISFLFGTQMIEAYVSLML